MKGKKDTLNERERDPWKADWDPAHAHTSTHMLFLLCFSSSSHKDDERRVPLVCVHLHNIPVASVHCDFLYPLWSTAQEKTSLMALI